MDQATVCSDVSKTRAFVPGGADAGHQICQECGAVCGAAQIPSPQLGTTFLLTNSALGWRSWNKGNPQHKVAAAYVYSNIKDKMIPAFL